MSPSIAPTSSGWTQTSIPLPPQHHRCCAASPPRPARWLSVIWRRPPHQKIHSSAPPRNSDSHRSASCTPPPPLPAQRHSTCLSRRSCHSSFLARLPLRRLRPFNRRIALPDRQKEERDRGILHRLTGGSLTARRSSTSPAAVVVVVVTCLQLAARPLSPAMDQANAAFKFRRSSSKLHKEPPSFSSSRVLKSQQSNTSLKRHPSAPVYPRSLGGSREHLRTRSNAYGSSSSSLDQNSAGPSPVLSSNEFSSSPGTYTSSKSRPGLPGRLSLNDRSSDELIGAPFDARGMLNALEETISPSQQNSIRRPPAPHSSHTSPELRGVQTLRQSSSHTALNPRMETAPQRLDDDRVQNQKRFSDEANGTKSTGRSKKSSFSSFVNSMLGSPRNIKISAPENPVHVTHVGYDNQTGQFTVC